MVVDADRPEGVRRLLAAAQEDIDERCRVCRSMAERWPAVDFQPFRVDR